MSNDESQDTVVLGSPNPDSCPDTYIPEIKLDTHIPLHSLWLCKREPDGVIPLGTQYCHGLNELVKKDCWLCGCPRASGTLALAAHISILGKLETVLPDGREYWTYNGIWDEPIDMRRRPINYPTSANKQANDNGGGEGRADGNANANGV